MHPEIPQPPTISGYANGPPTKAPNWHGLVAWDMLFNNLTTGLFLAAAVAELALPQIFTTVAKAAYPLALVLLFADLLCLVLDLGDPWRFHHMLRVFKPSSPMSLGTWCLTVYALPLTLLAVFSLVPGEGPALIWVRRLAVIAGLLPALGSAVYKGVLFSTSSQPAWKDARWLGSYLANSAFLLGCAELLAVSVVMGQEKATAILRSAMLLLLLLNAVALGLLLIDVHPPLACVYTHKALLRLAALTLGGGMLVPLGLLVAGSPAALLCAGLFLVLGKLIVRFQIVYLPHVLGKTSEGRKMAEIRRL